MMVVHTGGRFWVCSVPGNVKLVGRICHVPHALQVLMPQVVDFPPRPVLNTAGTREAIFLFSPGRRIDNCGSPSFLPGRQLIVYEPTKLFKLLFCLCAVGATYMAVVHPDALAIISTATLHGVVGVVRFCHFLIWINYNLEEVVSWSHVGDIYPLTVNIMSVDVPASNADALFSKVCAYILLLYIGFTF